jgi:uncharacterized protein YecE (DUF72 family)
VDLYVGTSGFSYKEWKGTFYPDDLPNKDMLRYYGGRLTAVEINNTFYRLPKASVLEGWREQVPGGFRFSIKASRKITHFKRLKPEARDETEYLVRTVAALDDRLGMILFQLPPNMKADVPRLTAFLDLVPTDVPAAFEFRHESWKADAVRDALMDRRAALVCADTEDPDGDEPIAATTDWGYLRLRRPTYTDWDLARWAEHVRSQKWMRAFVFFKHEDEGAGPRMAERFRSIFNDLATGHHR